MDDCRTIVGGWIDFDGKKWSFCPGIPHFLSLPRLDYYIIQAGSYQFQILGSVPGRDWPLFALSHPLLSYNFYMIGNGGQKVLISGEKYTVVPGNYKRMGYSFWSIFTFMGHFD